MGRFRGDSRVDPDSSIPIEKVEKAMKQISGTIASPKGFYADGTHCGLKKEKVDIGWVYSQSPANLAAVFTTNQVKAAPVLLAKERAAAGSAQGLIVNAGNANACTGEQGKKDAAQMAQLTAQRLGVEPESILVASTGIIGKPLPMDKIAKGIKELKSDGAGEKFQQAILTTDLVEKAITVTEVISDCEITMSGCAKGSGMIHPNMATMLGFVTTDAAISTELLQELLSELTEVTFNQITVDGDTSTNDAVFVLANGQAKNQPIEKNTQAYFLFKEMLIAVLTYLAKAIAKDGEGATKLITAVTTGAADDFAARMISKSIVGSPLVKTAIFGKDPNWGRILCAAGYSGQEICSEKLSISLAGIPVFENGLPLSFEVDEMQEQLTKDEVEILVQLQEGSGTGTAWGCDLTYEYVKINALYHT